MALANNAVYTHTHVLTDGTIVTHSHPFNKSDDSKPIKSHKHTITELVVLDNLSLLFFIFFLSPAIALLRSRQAKLMLKVLHYQAIAIIQLKDRAPPKQ